ncbi:hypothetical protein LTR62_001123 [Meristemomyces frigidus]|uniref:peptidylprolyl isomerase n=1 Tax=Meristemomyces frigidus TaxID=1508187 RepID=A0AAN7YIB0_9PEZI|nr:hypothetical protein LTR62_001123 [Meristemomyces frigidus]
MRTDDGRVLSSRRLAFEIPIAAVQRKSGNDSYTRDAKLAGLKSRAAFKLLEINEKYRLFRRGDTVVDLGYAPGSWSQVAANRTAPGGRVVGIDVIPAMPPRGVSTIQGNFLSEEVRREVKEFVLDPAQGRVVEGGEEEAGDEIAEATAHRGRGKKTVLATAKDKADVAEGRVVDVVLSDMCEPWPLATSTWTKSVNNPYRRMMNTSGMPFRDHAGSMDLCLAALEFCYDTLATGGNFLCKFYQGGEDQALETRLKKLFEKVHRIKPDSSRKESKEAYLVGMKRKAGVEREAVLGEAIGAGVYQTPPVKMRSLRLLPAPLLALLSSAAAQESKTLDSGLIIETTTPVICSRPTRSGDQISVNYRGTLLDTGALFDESYKRGQPFKFYLGGGQVIKGWDEGLMDMCPGERRKLTIPPEMAYGDRGAGGVIGPGAWLVFETELMDIVGVKQESIVFPSTSSAAETMDATATVDGTLSIATAPSTPPKEQEDEEDIALEATPLHPETTAEPAEGQAECRLLGPFALLVQAALGAMAILSLVWKRYRETPKRPWKIWFFDVSKQVTGSMLTHVLNLAMSMLSSVDMVNVAQVAGTQGAKDDPDGRMPNPCSYYLLNLGIDTTIGIPVLYVLLKVLHAAFLRTPLATPPESIKSGNYGQPPRARWWAKQLLIYFIGLTGMKLFVFFLFAALPWLPWVGDWALRWTKGNEALEVTFAMFIFPLGMNAIQYWIIDNFIMDKKTEEGGAKGDYEAVGDAEDEGEDGRRGLDGGEEGSVTEVGEDVDAVGAKQVDEAPLREVNPTPVESEREEGGSGKRTPLG